jgi:flagellar hook-length control protein FliK
MDIKLPVNLLNPSTLNKLVENPLSLKVGQKLDVKVISTLLKTEINTIALKLANSTINVQSNQAIELAPGQELQIQVTKVSPVLEFAIVLSTQDLKRKAIAPDLRLKLITPTTDKQNTDSTAESSLPLKQPLVAKIIALTASKIQLQIFTETPTSQKQQKTAEQPGGTKPFIVITIDRSQLNAPKSTPTNQPNLVITNSPAAASAPTEFKIGQPVILEISSKGTTPEYQISVAPPPNMEEKVTGLIKQFLPKHEASPVLLNQLIKELPQLLKNNSVSVTLQRMAAQILQNLPQRQQLNDSAGLKRAFVSSGLFLEAKMPELKEKPELTIEQDFKANLLKLVDALKKEVVNPEKIEVQDIDLATLKHLQQKTENSLAKLSLDQLTSLPKEDNSKQIWTMELPFVDRGRADSVNIQIERDKDTNHQTSENDNWSVMVTLNPPGLGTIQCKLAYQNETINTYFRSQQAETTELISQHLEHLKHQFEEAGLKAGVINVLDGLQTTKAAYQTDKNMLFDEKA